MVLQLGLQSLEVLGEIPDDQYDCSFKYLDNKLLQIEMDLVDNYTLF